MKRLVHDVIHVLKASLYFILQVVIPPIHNRACYYSTPDYTDNAYYLYRYALKERNGIEHVWLVDDITNAARIQEEFDALDVSGKQHSIIIKKRKSVSGAWCALRSRWFFYTHNVFRFARTGYRRALVNLWHGMPIKKIGSFDASAPDVRLAYGTHYIATTWFFRYLVACAFNAAYDRIIVAQQPRCDVLCGWQPPQSSKQIILQKMGISGDKVILWAPTFRQMSKVKTSDRSRSFLDDVPEELLKVIDQYAKLKKIVVVVKLHPSDVLNYRTIPWEYSNLYLAKSREWQEFGFQLYDFVAHVDALISDVSSIAIDYLITARPIGIVGYNCATYDRGLMFPLKYLLKDSECTELVDESSVLTFFDRISAADAEYETSRNSIFFDDQEDVSGSERILSAVGL